MRTLASIGGYLAAGGIISGCLSLIGYELRLLMWIDNWGTGVGWGIRVALVVVGLSMYMLVPSEEPDEVPAPE